jgi:programmed cell death protein 5|tara:strand:- start:72 stop:350 length:279 start_codon:yes stop_codon:yes gene_type:complete
MSNPNDEQTGQPTEEQANIQKDIMLKQILSSDARVRLNNVKLVKPELANLVENYLIGLATQGRAQGQITDDQLKQILMSTQKPKRDFKINRV